jgi:hypothetical protein
MLLIPYFVNACFKEQLQFYNALSDRVLSVDNVMIFGSNNKFVDAHAHIQCLKNYLVNFCYTVLRAEGSL